MSRSVNDPSCYDVLGISSSATTDEVKAAYRKLAKRHHPDVNPEDATAAERFKQMTSAYTEALLLSSKRERDAERASSSSSSSQGVRGGPRGPRTSRMSNDSPRATSGPVNERRFNVREWESAHYGLKGATAEERQSQYIRNLYKGQRPQRPSAGFYYQARSGAQQQQQPRRAAQGAGHLAIVAIAACASVWSAVYSTNFGRYNANKR